MVCVQCDVQCRCWCATGQRTSVKPSEGMWNVFFLIVIHRRPQIPDIRSFWLRLLATWQLGHVPND